MNRKEIVIIAIIFLLTVLAWIVFDVYHAKTTSTVIKNETLQQIVPLTPVFDNDIIRKLKTREE